MSYSFFIYISGSVFTDVLSDSISDSSFIGISQISIFVSILLNLFNLLISSCNSRISLLSHFCVLSIFLILLNVFCSFDSSLSHGLLYCLFCFFLSCLSRLVSCCRLFFFYDFIIPLIAVFREVSFSITIIASQVFQFFHFVVCFQEF